jgi:hypothetical protein
MKFKFSSKKYSIHSVEKKTIYLVNNRFNYDYEYESMNDKDKIKKTPIEAKIDTNDDDDWVPSFIEILEKEQQLAESKEK